MRQRGASDRQVNSGPSPFVITCPRFLEEKRLILKQTILNYSDDFYSEWKLPSWCPSVCPYAVTRWYCHIVSKRPTLWSLNLPQPQDSGFIQKLERVHPQQESETVRPLSRCTSIFWPDALTALERLWEIRLRYLYKLTLCFDLPRYGAK